MKSAAITFSLVVGAFGTGCDKQPAESDEPVLRSLVSRYPCEPHRFTIVAAPEDSLTTNERCALVHAGIDAILTNATNELQAADTAAIQSVKVTPFTFADTSSRVAESYWSVDYTLTGRSYDAVVRVDRKTGRITASSGHKAF